MVSYLSVVFCAVGLIGILLQNTDAAEQQLAEPEVEINSDNFYDEEKRGGGRAFAPSDGLKRAGGRGFYNYYNSLDKRGGGRGFNFNDAMDKRAGGRAFNAMDKRGGGRSFNSFFDGYGYQYPLVYKKAFSADSYVPYYLQELKRGGGRSWSIN